jgi:hypothetical protein
MAEVDWIGKLSEPKAAPVLPVFVASGEFVAGFVPPEYLLEGIVQRRFVYSMTGMTGAPGKNDPFRAFIALQ